MTSHLNKVLKSPMIIEIGGLVQRSDF